MCLVNNHYPIVTFINKDWSINYKIYFINNINLIINKYGIKFFIDHCLDKIKECVFYRDIAESFSTSNVEIYLEFFSKDFPEFINKSFFSITK